MAAGYGTQTARNIHKQTDKHRPRNFVNNQHDAQLFFLYMFIPILYMFRATMCSSSGQSIVSIRPLVYVTLETVEWPKIPKRLS